MTWLRKRIVKIVIDVSLLAGFIAEFITREGPDYAIHSWIGIALVPVIVFHLFSNTGWIKRVWKKKRDDKEFGLALLNSALGILASVCIITGFPLWLDWSEADQLATSHQLTGMGSILLMFAHLFKNRGRIVRLVKA